MQLGKTGRVFSIVIAILAIGVAGLKIEAYYRLPKNQHCDVLERLKIHDAPSAAARDMKRGDVHLFAVDGYSTSLPGLSEETGGIFPTNYRVVEMPCASDEIVSKWHGVISRRAAIYAAVYNRAILAKPGAPRPQFATPDNSSGQ